MSPNPPSRYCHTDRQIRLVMNAGNKKKKAEKEHQNEKEHRGWGWGKAAATPSTPPKTDEKVPVAEAPKI